MSEYRILVMNAWSVESSEVAIQTCQNYKDAGVVLRCTLGLHPTPSQTHGAPMCPDIKKMGKPLKRIRTFLASNKEVVKGIGNCGLHYMPTVEELFPQRLPDKSQDPRGWLKLKLSKSRYSQRFITNTQHQLTFIKRQVRIAEVAKLPITLRVKDDLDQLRPTYVKFPDIRKLLHFTPNTNMRFMKRLISLPNSYLGLPTWLAVERHRSTLSELLEAYDLDKFMLESGHPLAPLSKDSNNDFKPERLLHLVDRIAAITGKSEDEIAAQTTATATLFYDLQ